MGNDPRIFRPEVVEGFEWVQPLDESDFDATYQLDGSRLGDRWEPIRMRALESDESGHPLARADLPWLGGHALVFRDQAYRAAREILIGSGEFLPLDLVGDSERLWLYNVCCVADVLDEDASEVVRFPSSGRLMKINRHVFRSEAASLVAFRVPQVRTLFLASTAVDQLIALEFSGASFTLVWQG